ncbi:MAG TPA: DNA starvation/stationary phase protection protein [Bryobacteraceae bacterium]|nr:DNA starvation/stationary phase protection protein [Bryobacteraceae bacterium]
MRTTHTKPHSRNEAPSSDRLDPIIREQGSPIQVFGNVRSLPIALDSDARKASVDLLNQLLADTMTIRDLYKKCHWQVVGHTFYQLHLLFDKHYGEQAKLIDSVAERIQMLGGLSIAMAADVAEMTHIPRPPRDREAVPMQLSRLLRAHEIILREAREAARTAGDNADDGTNDLLISEVIRTNEMQVWFLSEHLMEEPVLWSEGENVDEQLYA